MRIVSVAIELVASSAVKVGIITNVVGVNALKLIYTTQATVRCTRVKPVTYCVVCLPAIQYI